MNYIKDLECQVIETNDRIIGMLDRINEFQQHLSSPKFVTIEEGERKDWISVADVLRWMRYIESGIN